MQLGTYFASPIGAQQAKALPPLHSHGQAPDSLLGSIAVLHGTKQQLPRE